MSQELERVYTINLGKVLLSQSQHRAVRAINMIREFARHHMKVEEIKIEEELAHQIWARGVRRPPRKIRVRMSKTDEGYVLVSQYVEEIESKTDGTDSKKIEDPVEAKKETPAAEVKETPAAEVKETPAAEVKETPAAEVKETPAAEVKETPAAEVKETPAAEVKETPAAEVKETPAAEVKETPAAEVKETPAAEVKETPAAEVKETKSSKK